MTKTIKISFITAVLININIVIGAAFFLQAPLIMQQSGALAPLVWIAVGILLLPLVVALAQLAQHFPSEGGLYVYSKNLLGPLWGFISGWGYYLGTVAGNAVVLAAFRNQLEMLNVSSRYLPISLDTLCILIFSVINIFNIEFMQPLQYGFTFFKAIPLLLVGVGGILFFSSSSALSAVTTDQIIGATTSLPLVLFAYLGIEACCAIGHIINDGKKNAARVILYSFAIIVSIYACVQFFLGSIPGLDGNAPFNAIAFRIIQNPRLAQILSSIISFALLSSYLGGFYSMFYANNWNLHILAKEGTVPLARLLLKENKFGTPFACLMLQSGLIYAFLRIMPNLVMLTTMSDFGIIISYLLSTAAFFKFASSTRQKLIALCATGSCFFLLYTCGFDLYFNGAHATIPFLCLFSIGITYFLYIQKKLRQ